MPSHVRRRKRVVEAGVENAEGEWRGAYEDIPTRARTRSLRAPKPCTHGPRPTAGNDASIYPEEESLVPRGRVRSRGRGN